MKTTIDKNANAVERLQAAINAFGQPRIVERNDEIVEATIRTGLLLNSIMEEFIQYIYTPHPEIDGYLCLTASGAIRRGVIAPWAYSNKATTRDEKKRIRSRFTASLRGGHAPLFAYNKRQRNWYLNIDKYSTTEAALRWWDVYKIPSINPLDHRAKSVANSH